MTVTFTDTNAGKTFEEGEDKDDWWTDKDQAAFDLWMVENGYTDEAEAFAVYW